MKAHGLETHEPPAAQLHDAQQAVGVAWAHYSEVKDTEDAAQAYSEVMAAENDLDEAKARAEMYHGKDNQTELC